MKELTTVLSWLLIERRDRGRAGGGVSEIKGKPKLVSPYNFWLTGLCIECVSEAGREGNMLGRLISIVLHVPLLRLEDRRWPGEKRRRGGGMRDGGGGSAGSALRWRKRERGEERRTGESCSLRVCGDERDERSTVRQLDQENVCRLLFLFFIL